jgi:hypothetical protein
LATKKTSSITIYAHAFCDTKIIPYIESILMQVCGGAYYLQVAKDIIYVTESNHQHHPHRYDLMRELPLATTEKQYAPRFGKSVVRPALGSLMNSIREKSKQRKAASVLPVPRRKPYSSFVPRINEVQIISSHI